MQQIEKEKAKKLVKDAIATSASSGMPVGLPDFPSIVSALRNRRNHFEWKHSPDSPIDAEISGFFIGTDMRIRNFRIFLIDPKLVS